MSAYAYPLIYTLFLWWFSTGLILWLDRLPRATYRWSMLGASLVLGLSLYALWVTRDDTSVSGAYCSFTCAILIWGWHEMSFLMGFITGPRRTPCPARCSEGQRVVFATQTILYHELALLGCIAVIAAITWGSANQLGLWTFVILWVMRLSAKLNLFLGVRNLSEDFLPDSLRYLESYFRRRPINLLFPVVVSAATVVAVIGWLLVADDEANRYESVSLNFLSTLLSLAILEHWFMVLPLPTSALWKWSLREKTEPARAEASIEVKVL